MPLVRLSETSQVVDLFDFSIHRRRHDSLTGMSMTLRQDSARSVTDREGGEFALLHEPFIPRNTSRWGSSPNAGRPNDALPNSTTRSCPRGRRRVAGAHHSADTPPSIGDDRAMAFCALSVLAWLGRAALTKRQRQQSRRRADTSCLCGRRALNPRHDRARTAWRNASPRRPTAAATRQRRASALRVGRASLGVCAQPAGRR
jgi:hypothetical protein